MKQFFFFIKKEFLHLWRDKRTMFILFGMPMVQIFIFGFVLTNEVKDSRIAILLKPLFTNLKPVCISTLKKVFHSHNSFGLSAKEK